MLHSKSQPYQQMHTSLTSCEWYASSLAISLLWSELVMMRFPLKWPYLPTQVTVMSMNNWNMSELETSILLTLSEHLLHSRLIKRRSKACCGRSRAGSSLPTSHTYVQTEVQWPGLAHARPIRPQGPLKRSARLIRAPVIHDVGSLRFYRCFAPRE
jgi:hypothetical protein